jgi:hypothetical protein
VPQPWRRSTGLSYSRHRGDRRVTPDEPRTDKKALRELEYRKTREGKLLGDPWRRRNVVAVDNLRAESCGPSGSRGSTLLRSRESDPLSSTDGVRPEAVPSADDIVPMVTMAAMAALGVRSRSVPFTRARRSRRKRQVSANGSEPARTGRQLLPCRRSWVRVPSSAPCEAPGNGGFSFAVVLSARPPAGPKCPEMSG